MADATDAAAATITGIPDMVYIGIFIIFALVVIYLIIREIRIMRTTNRSIELELERDKLKLLQQHEATKFLPFTRFSPEQTAEIRQVEDENTAIGTDNYAKENLLDKRLSRLESIVKSKKLDTMLHNVGEQEKKVK
jgi:flagellar biosynthesis/type III secretory pathway M-ring protein FliF/YscJ